MSDKSRNWRRGAQSTPSRVRSRGNTAPPLPGSMRVPVSSMRTQRSLSQQRTSQAQQQSPNVSTQKDYGRRDPYISSRHPPQPSLSPPSGVRHVLGWGVVFVLCVFCKLIATFVICECAPRTRISLPSESGAVDVSWL